MVSVKIIRNDKVVFEVCEVMACQAAGETGSWRILVATQDGALMDTYYKEITLVTESAGDGPYR